jgi:hypothetical protein
MGAFYHMFCKSKTAAMDGEGHIADKFFIIF